MRRTPAKWRALALGAVAACAPEPDDAGGESGTMGEPPPRIVELHASAAAIGTADILVITAVVEPEDATGTVALADAVLASFTSSAGTQTADVPWSSFAAAGSVLLEVRFVDAAERTVAQALAIDVCEASAIACADACRDPANDAAHCGGCDRGCAADEDCEAGTCVAPAPMPCGLADLAPGAPDPIVAGDGAMQLPTAIGDIVVRSCGCHLADDLAVDVPDYPSAGALQLTSWAQWHAPFAETATPTFEIVAGRLMLDGPAGMPPPSACDVGDGATMAPADRTALLEWIAAGAPDGAAWPAG